MKQSFRILRHQILKYGVSPFEWLNKKQYKTEKSYFTYNNYTPLADRMYFTEDNALKIDGMRLDIEEVVP